MNSTHWGIYNAREAVEWINVVEKARGQRTKIGKFHFITTDDTEFGRSTLSCEKWVLFKKIVIYNIQTVSETAKTEKGQVFYWWDQNINQLQGVVDLLEIKR